MCCRTGYLYLTRTNHTRDFLTDRTLACRCASLIAPILQDGRGGITLEVLKHALRLQSYFVISHVTKTPLCFTARLMHVFACFAAKLTHLHACSVERHSMQTHNKHSHASLFVREPACPGFLEKATGFGERKCDISEMWKCITLGRSLFNVNR